MLVVLAALVCCFVSAVHAEVAMWVDPGNQELKSAFILQSIVDDPEPVGGSAWIRSHGADPGLVVLNEDGAANGDGPPSMAVDFATQTVVVAWAKNTPGGYDIVVSRNVNGAWSAPLTIANAASDEHDPFVVIDPADGTVHVLYWVDGGNPRVFHTSTPASFNAWGVPQQVSLVGEVAMRPSAVFHDGQLRVAYEVHDYGPGSTPRQISVATLDSQGFFAHEGLTVTQHGGANWARIHSVRGRLWVDWIDADGEMGWTRQIDSTWTPVELETYSGAEERDYHVRGAIRKLVTH